MPYIYSVVIMWKTALKYKRNGCKMWEHREYTDVNNERTLLRDVLPRSLQIVSMFYNYDTAKREAKGNSLNECFSRLKKVYVFSGYLAEH